MTRPRPSNCPGVFVALAILGAAAAFLAHACRRSWAALYRGAALSIGWLAAGERAHVVGVALGLFIAVPLAGPIFLSGCVSGQLQPAAVTAIEAGFAAACPAESLVPVAGPVLASACPGEEALLAAALAAATPQPQALQPARVALYRLGRAGERPLVPVGTIAAGPHAEVVQRALLAVSPIVKTPAKPLPAGPAVLPMADAGGGR